MKKMSLRSVSLLFFSFAVCLFMCMNGCKQEKENSIELGNTNNIELVKDGVLTVGTAPGFAPFESYVDGTLQGIDIDIANMIAKDLQLKVEFKTIKYDKILDAVINKEIDIAISAIDITSDKEKLVSFSSPYYSDGKIIVAKKDSSINNANLEQTMQNPNTRVAVREYTTTEEYFNQYYKTLKKLTCDTYGKVVDALENNSADVGMLYKSYMDAYPDSPITILKNVGSKDELGIAIDKTNYDLYQLINKDIAIRNSDGTISGYINKWLYHK